MNTVTASQKFNSFIHQLFFIFLKVNFAFIEVTWKIKVVSETQFQQPRNENLQALNYVPLVFTKSSIPGRVDDKK